MPWCSLAVTEAMVTGPTEIILPKVVSSVTTSHLRSLNSFSEAQRFSNSSKCLPDSAGTEIWGGFGSGPGCAAAGLKEGAGLTSVALAESLNRPMTRVLGG